MAAVGRGATLGVTFIRPDHVSFLRKHLRRFPQCADLVFSAAFDKPMDALQAALASAVLFGGDTNDSPTLPAFTNSSSSAPGNNPAGNSPSLSSPGPAFRSSELATSAGRFSHSSSRQGSLGGSSITNSTVSNSFFFRPPPSPPVGGPLNSNPSPKVDEDQEEEDEIPDDQPEKKDVVEETPEPPAPIPIKTDTPLVGPTVDHIASLLNGADLAGTPEVVSHSPSATEPFANIDSRRPSVAPSVADSAVDPAMSSPAPMGTDFRRASETSTVGAQSAAATIVPDDEPLRNVQNVSIIEPEKRADNMPGKTESEQADSEQQGGSWNLGSSLGLGIGLPNIGGWALPTFGWGKGGDEGHESDGVPSRNGTSSRHPHTHSKKKNPTTTDPTPPQKDLNSWIEEQKRIDREEVRPPANAFVPGTFSRSDTPILPDDDESNDSMLSAVDDRMPTHARQDSSDDAGAAGDESGSSLVSTPWGDIYGPLPEGFVEEFKKAMAEIGMTNITEENEEQLARAALSRHNSSKSRKKPTRTVSGTSQGSADSNESFKTSLSRTSRFPPSPPKAAEPPMPPHPIPHPIPQPIPHQAEVLARPPARLGSYASEDRVDHLSPNNLSVSPSVQSATSSDRSSRRTSRIFNPRRSSEQQQQDDYRMIKSSPRSTSSSSRTTGHGYPFLFVPQNASPPEPFPDPNSFPMPPDQLRRTGSTFSATSASPSSSSRSVSGSKNRLSRLSGILSRKKSSPTMDAEEITGGGYVDYGKGVPRRHSMLGSPVPSQDAPGAGPSNSPQPQRRSSLRKSSRYEKRKVSSPPTSSGIPEGPEEGSVYRVRFANAT